MSFFEVTVADVFDSELQAELTGAAFHAAVLRSPKGQSYRRKLDPIPVHRGCGSHLALIAFAVELDSDMCDARRRKGIENDDLVKACCFGCGSLETRPIV